LPNKNYQKGRSKEYKIKKILEREGYIVLRTAGSHGFADLVAISKEERLIRFIQCKPDDFPKSEENKLMEENSDFINHIWTSKFEVV